MISLQNVTKEFQLDEKTTITPVKNVTLNLDNGELIVIIGRSGTGKTTLLNLAAGLVRPTSGQVIIDGKDIARMSDRKVSAIRAEKIGFVFQFPSLLPAFSVIENIMLPSMFLSTDKKRDSTRKAKETLGIMGLGDKSDVFPKQLSAGEQKRVIISRALINDPQIIMADEPTSDLDNKTEAEVMNLLKEVNAKGVSFLIVTHSLQLLPFATRAFEMKGGALTEITGAMSGVGAGR
jgi:ABC-type lipoprotein export system ATPase subunit